jgi:M6 family metalloprotease-like protein
MKRLILLSLNFILLPGISWCVPASPGGVEVSQPDGTKIKVFPKGDEFYKWKEDGKGYTILKDPAAKAWLYAERGAGGLLKASVYRVGSSDPASLGLEKHLNDIPGLKRAARLRETRDVSSLYHVAGGGTLTGMRKTPILTGTMKNLVILAKFAGASTTFTQAQYNSLFNDIGYSYDGAAGSVKDYYLQVSYNKLTVQSVVTAWVTLPNNYAYYGANDINGNDARPQEMVRDAIVALHNTGFDFSQVDGNGDGEIDGLTIIHSGRGEEYGANDPSYIWSHQWELSAPISYNGVRMFMYHTEPEIRGGDGDPAGISRIGVICHETGHFFGLPDLYDYTGVSHGIGEFCLMAHGSWNGNYGTSPAHLSAW